MENEEKPQEKLSRVIEELIAKAATRTDLDLCNVDAHMGRRCATLVNWMRALVADVLREEEKSRRYLHNDLLGRVQSELFEVLQALQPRPGLIDYGSLRAKVEAARTSANELGKQFAPEHGLLDEGSAQPETGTYRLPSSLIVDELERAMGGILATSFLGPQLKKLLADLRGAMASEAQDLTRRFVEWRGSYYRALAERDEAEQRIKSQQEELTLRIDANCNAARLEKDLENTRLAHTRLAEEKRKAEAELTRTKQALVESEHLHQHAKTRVQLHEQDLATLRETVDAWQGRHRAMVKERDAALGELKQKIAELDRAYKTLGTMPAPSEIAKLEEELKKLHDARSKEHLENTLQQDDLRKQLARAEAANAGLRRDVENHLAAQSYIASALGVETNGSWQPIKEQLVAESSTSGRSWDEVYGVGGVNGNRLITAKDWTAMRNERAQLRRQIRDLSGKLSTCQENETQLSPILRSLATRFGVAANWPDIRAKVFGLAAELEEANRRVEQWRLGYEGDQHRIAKLIFEKEALEAQIGHLQRGKVHLLEEENKVLAERLGRAYQMEMDARRALAETANRLDNTYKEMRTRVGALEKRVELLKSTLRLLR